MHLLGQRSLLLLSFLLPLTLAAQSNKKLDKAIEKFNAGEMEEAISDARKLLGGKDDLRTWNTLVDMYEHRYRDAVDPSARIAKELMLNMSRNSGPNVVYARDKEACLSDLLNACREATYATPSTHGSQILRNFLVDTYPDTAVSKEAKEAFEQAEEAFGKKEYKAAITAYRRTLALAPDHYKAVLYIGDCYYYLNEDDSAVAYFRSAITMQPQLLEPRKYIVDALASMKANEQALEEALATFSIYPDESMFLKTSDLCERMGRRFDRHWLPRGTTANVPGLEQADGKGPWKRYRDAKAEIAPFCDAKGLVNKPGAPDGAKYMEIYCWQRMLDGGDLPAEMDFARQMAAAGNLDCYVFICLFHHDIHDQFKVFAQADKDRIRRFFMEQLMR